LFYTYSSYTRCFPSFNAKIFAPMQTRILLFFCFLLAGSTLYAGGPWAPGKFHGFGQLSYTFIRYNELLAFQGENPVLRRYARDFTVQAYAEVGITDKITLTAALPFKILSTEDEIIPTTYLPDTLPAGRLNGFSNIALAGKYTFTQDKVAVSAQVRVETRNFRVDYSTGLRTGYENWTFIPTIAVGKGWNKGYLFTDSGVAIRTHNYSHEVRALVEGGYQPVKDLWFSLNVDLRHVIVNRDFDDGSVEHTALYINNAEYNAWGVKASYQFANKIGLNFGFYGALGGARAAAFPSINSGLFYTW